MLLHCYNNLRRCFHYRAYAVFLLHGASFRYYAYDGQYVNWQSQLQPHGGGRYNPFATQGNMQSPATC